MKIEWQNDIHLAPEILSVMQLAADRTLAVEKISVPCMLSVRLCDDEMIRTINREYRNLDKPTDVLSFPTVNYPVGKTAGCCEKLLRMEFDDEAGACFLGDIIISVPRLKEQAREYGHSDSREAVYLLIHGICHLMGYDHIEEADKSKMRAQEDQILKSLDMDREERYRIEDSTLLELAKDAMNRSYSPYSHYPVGAALHCTDGRVFLGCNIENASFGLTNCAERTAMFKAISEGARHFDVIAIAAKSSQPWPCGACRQVLNEFAPDIRVLITWGKGETAEKSLQELLPCAFGPEDVR